MSQTEKIITILMVILGTVITRFIPFIVFRDEEKTPKYVRFLGNAIPPAVFGLLVVYCLKDVSLISYGIPEAIAIGFVILLHLWQRKMLLSIAGGTVLYMVLVQIVF